MKILWKSYKSGDNLHVTLLVETKACGSIECKSGGGGLNTTI